MMGEENNTDAGGIEGGEELLRQLFHLKRYETPETARMTRNKQNIMREVRELSRSRRKSLADLIEINFPWFFAEPKYGVAMLFVVFAGLQYLGVNARHAAQSDPGIYTSNARFTAYSQPAAAVSTNQVAFPEVPSGLRLFRDQPGRGDVKWVSNPSAVNWDQ